MLVIISVTGSSFQKYLIKSTHKTTLPKQQRGMYIAYMIGHIWRAPFKKVLFKKNDY